MSRADASVPDADVDDDAGVVADPSPHKAPPEPVMMGGLTCDGVICPFASEPTAQCCTTQSDVDGKRARAADRCGVELGALKATSFGQGCWQRDQLGIVDDACPSYQSDTGDPPEPGCCTDDGQCGTVNASQQLGCRHAPMAANQACGDKAANTCDAVGSYALRFTADAAWAGFGGVTDDGRGEIEIELLVSIMAVDEATRALTGKGRVCNVELPPFFSSILCEGFKPTFPESLWESGGVPGFDFTGRYECAAGGCVLAVDPVNYLLGIELNNPVAPWPAADQTRRLRCTAGSGADCFPDHDGDGQPGITVQLPTGGMMPGDGFCSSGYQFSAAPLSASIAAVFDGVHRADRMNIGVRTRVGASMRLSDDCDSATGSALVENINSRAISCVIQPGTYNFPDFRRAGANEVCSVDEAQFLDDNMPVYELLAAGEIPRALLDLRDRSASKGPDIRLVRLGAATDTFSCERVREAMK